MSTATHAATLHQEPDIAHFHSGSGFAAPSRLRAFVAVKGLRFLVASQRLGIRGGTHSSEPGFSRDLQAFSMAMLKFRMDCTDLKLWRQTFLCCVCPSLPDVRWSPVLSGAVPGWICTTEPDVTAKQEVLLYVHGGGLAGGDAGCFQGITSRLAKGTNRKVIIPHYRLTPEATRDEAVDDVVEFILGMPSESSFHLAAAGDKDGKAQHCIDIVADSAGGYVSHNAVQDARCAELARHLVLLSPMLGLVPLESPKVQERAATDPVTSQVTVQWCYDMAKIVPPLPALLVHEGETPIYAPNVTVYAASGELLFPDAEALIEALKQVDGVTVTAKFREGFHFHGWPTLAGFGLPECDDTLDEIMKLLMR